MGTKEEAGGLASVTHYITTYLARTGIAFALAVSVALVREDELMLAVSRDLLGLAAGESVDIEFK